jgi:hypothetical protein
MRRRLCAMSLLGMVAVCSASAQTPVPERKDRSLTPASSSAGSSSAPGAASPEEASAEQERVLDERRATESKQKMKKRPGYRHEVPTPRA